MRKLHDFLAPGTPQMAGALAMLPDILQDDEVVIACYTHYEGEIVVAGYYVWKGFYEGHIARPDGFRGDISVASSRYSEKAREVCGLDDCWAGGDTGGFYYEF